MSDNVTVNVIELPVLTEDGLGETAVIVECGWLTVSEDVPELVA